MKGYHVMPDNLEDIGKAMMQAWGRIKKAQSRMWGDWMTIGEGLLEGRRWAMKTAGVSKPEGKGYVLAYGEWLKRFKMEDMHEADRTKLLQLMEERPGVEEWRAALPDKNRRDLNHPTTVWRKYRAATKIKKPKSRTAGSSATEMGRARATVEEQQARIDELEEECFKADDEPAVVADRILTMYPSTAKEIARLILARLPKHSKRKTTEDQPNQGAET